jgi:hypothetical protein
MPRVPRALLFRKGMFEAAILKKRFRRFGGKNPCEIQLR